MTPRVVKVSAEKDYKLFLIFNNGEEKIFDMTPYLSIGVFKELQDLKLFSTVRPFMGAVCWKNGQDLSPETLYIESKPLEILTAK